MADQTHVQHLRGNTARNDAFTGAVGELTINTDIPAIRLHDGLKEGGYGTVDAAHYNGTSFPTTVPTDLRTGAIVTLGDGPLDGHVNGYVHDTGDEAISGKKTFLTSPLVPTPALGDSTDAVANTAFIRQSMGAGLVYNPVSKQYETELKVATQDMTFYVRKTGSDDNDGLTPDTAFLTIGRALREVSVYTFVNSTRPTIDIGAGTYTISSASPENYMLLPLVTGTYSSGIIKGAGKDETIIECLIQYSIFASQGVWDIQNMTIRTDKSSGDSAVYLQAGSRTIFRNCKFSGKSNTYMVFSYCGGCCGIASCDFESTGCIAFLATMDGAITFSGTNTANGTATYTVAAFDCGTISRVLSGTFSGNVTGSRYRVVRNGNISTDGGGANFFPGSTVGTTAAGGQYN